jgi:hypothetical protein
VLLAGFQHRPGIHGASTALSDALRVRGLDLPEHLVFGLGAGLGFSYVTGPSLSPTHLFLGRSWRLEQTACDVLGAGLVERTDDDPERAWASAAEALARGFAPILSADLARLPYAGASAPFNGHRVVLAGYDPERRVAFVADGKRDELCEVGLDDLERARASEAPPLGYTGRHWMEVDAPARRRPMPEAIADALQRQAREMLLEASGATGVAALERFAEELPAWSRRAAGEADRAWCFRLGSRTIDRAGAGLFRGLYARFLEESEGIVPSLSRLGLAARMRHLAERWSSLGEAFGAIADAPGAGAPPGVVRIAAEIARGERRFYEEVAARVP